MREKVHRGASVPLQFNAPDLCLIFSDPHARPVIVSEAISLEIPLNPPLPKGEINLSLARGETSPLPFVKGDTEGFLEGEEKERGGFKPPEAPVILRVSVRITEAQ